MNIRIARIEDADAVRGIHLSAFPDTESEAVSRLAVDLLLEETTPPTLSLLAEKDGVAVGHVAFSPVMADGTVDFLGYILTPLAVSPSHQKTGIGSALIERGIGQLSEIHPGILLVYGDPDYYGRFGFTANAADPYTPPYPLQYPFGWQGMLLGDCPAPPEPVTIACVSSLAKPALWS